VLYFHNTFWHFVQRYFEMYGTWDSCLISEHALSLCSGWRLKTGWVKFINLTEQQYNKKFQDI